MSNPNNGDALATVVDINVSTKWEQYRLPGKPVYRYTVENRRGHVSEIIFFVGEDADGRDELIVGSSQNGVCAVDIGLQKVADYYHKKSFESAACGKEG